ncbi:hypothetical protein TNCV_2716841 [Trichonephila clavipes]|nr:hypothetical protein TNCV_2716841 [Trichonephila clavipes]
MNYKVLLQLTLLYLPLAVGEESLLDSKLVLAENGRCAWTAYSSSSTWWFCLVTRNERVHEVDDVTTEKFCDPAFIDQETACDAFVEQL